MMAFYLPAAASKYRPIPCQVVRATNIIMYIRQATFTILRMQKYSTTSHLRNQVIKNKKYQQLGCSHSNDNFNLVLRRVPRIVRYYSLSTNSRDRLAEVQCLLSDLNMSFYSKLEENQTGPASVSGEIIINNINLLYKLGMTNDDIKLCETKNKGFLKSVYMSSHLQFLASIGLDDKDICNIMHRVPRFFMSAPYIAESIVQYMVDVGVSRKNVRNLLIFSPSLFYRVKGRPQQIGNLLVTIMQEHQPNVDAMSILAHMLRNDIKLFNRTEKEVKRNLRFLIELGVEGMNLVKIMHYCPSVLRIGIDFLQVRWTYLQKKLQLNDQEIIPCIKKYPRILTLADDNLKEKFEFLYGEAGFRPAEVANNPRLFERSLPHLQGRLKILQELKYEGDFIPLLVVWGKMFDGRVEKLRHLQSNVTGE